MQGDLPPQKPNLTFDEAVEVWRLHKLGVVQHWIAARFGINPGRVSDVLKERKHIGSSDKLTDNNPLIKGGRALSNRPFQSRLYS